MIPTLVHNISNKEQEQVVACLQVYDIQYKILGLAYTDLHKLVRRNKFIITFGSIATGLINAEIEDIPTPPVVIKLPHPSKLINKPGNSPHRKETASKLQELKDLIACTPMRPEDLTISKQELPDLQEEQLLILSKLTETDSILLIARDSSIIEIGRQRQHADKAEIHLSIEELLLIQRTMEVLDIKEVQLIKGEQCSNPLLKS
jgi:hypothetical protein